MTTDERACAQLYRDLCDASIRKDADAITALLADDYALIHMTGMRQSREEYVEAVWDGTLNYYQAKHEDIEVIVAPDGLAASIRGRSRITAAVFGGGRHTWRLQQDLKAVKRDGTWLLLESRASTY